MQILMRTPHKLNDEDQTQTEDQELKINLEWPKLEMMGKSS